MWNLQWKRNDSVDLPSDRTGWLGVHRVGFFIGILSGLFTLSFFSYLLKVVQTTYLLLSNLDDWQQFSFEYITSERVWKISLVDVLGAISLWKWGFILIFVFSVCVGFLAYRKVKHAFPEKNYGQKGSSYFETLPNLLRQYTLIAEDTLPVHGHGGLPVCHISFWNLPLFWQIKLLVQGKYYPAYYLIDERTSHTVVVGTSRSGKGESVIFPLIDNISRSDKKDSMVIFSPKAETDRGSVPTLLERGMKVFVFSTIEPLFGISWNPLQTVIDLKRKGEDDEVTAKVDLITEVIYKDAGAKDPFWQKTGKSCVSAIILAMVDLAHSATQNGDESAYDRCTMYNVIQILNELGKPVRDQETKSEVTELSRFFDSLPQGNLGKQKFATVNLASEKTRASIFAVALSGLEIFQSNTEIGLMTSRNSISMKSLGFPRTLIFKGNSTSFFGQLMTLSFYRKNKDQYENFGRTYSFRPKKTGRVEVDFEEILETGDVIALQLSNEEKIIQRTYKVVKTYEEDKFWTDESRELKQAKKACIKLEEHSTNPTILSSIFGNSKDIHAMQLVEQVSLDYEERPIALFIDVPDNNKTTHELASLFISQLYDVLTERCQLNINDHVLSRLHLILDEFGNMPVISELGTKMTVSAGRQILWYLFLQYEAQAEQYGKEKEAVFEAQNQMYIMSLDEKAHKRFSHASGHRTVEERSHSVGEFGSALSHNSSIHSVENISEERIAQMMTGENIIKRVGTRSDKKGRSIRPRMIFNTKNTKFPMRYEMKRLSKQFNPKQNMTWQLQNKHRYLNLKNNNINLDWFLNTIETKKKVEAEKETEQSLYEKMENEKRIQESQKQVSEKREEAETLEATFQQDEMKCMAKMFYDLQKRLRANGQLFPFRFSDNKEFRKGVITPLGEMFYEHIHEMEYFSNFSKEEVVNVLLQDNMHQLEMFCKGNTETFQWILEKIEHKSRELFFAQEQEKKERSKNEN